MLVLQPQVSRARSAKGEAIAPLRVRAREVAEAAQPVHISSRIDCRYANPSNAEATDVERVGVAP